MASNAFAFHKYQLFPGIRQLQPANGSMTIEFPYRPDDPSSMLYNFEDSTPQTPFPPPFSPDNTKTTSSSEAGALDTDTELDLNQEFNDHKLSTFSNTIPLDGATSMDVTAAITQALKDCPAWQTLANGPLPNGLWIPRPPPKNFQQAPPYSIQNYYYRSHPTNPTSELSTKSSEKPDVKNCPPSSKNPLPAEDALHKTKAGRASKSRPRLIKMNAAEAAAIIAASLPSPKLPSPVASSIEGTEPSHAPPAEIAVDGTTSLKSSTNWNSSASATSGKTSTATAKPATSDGKESNANADGVAPLPQPRQHVKVGRGRRRRPANNAPVPPRPNTLVDTKTLTGGTTIASIPVKKNIPDNSAVLSSTSPLDSNGSFSKSSEDTVKMAMSPSIPISSHKPDNDINRTLALNGNSPTNLPSGIALAVENSTQVAHPPPLQPSYDQQELNHFSAKTTSTANDDMGASMVGSFFPTNETIDAKHASNMLGFGGPLFGQNSSGGIGNDRSPMDSGYSQVSNSSINSTLSIGSSDLFQSTDDESNGPGSSQTGSKLEVSDFRADNNYGAIFRSGPQSNSHVTPVSQPSTPVLLSQHEQQQQQQQSHLEYMSLLNNSQLYDGTDFDTSDASISGSGSNTNGNGTQASTPAQSVKSLSGSSRSGNGDKGGRHRPNFTSDVVAMLVQWFEANIDNPYPTQEVKEAFAVQTGLTSAVALTSSNPADERVIRRYKTGITVNPEDGNIKQQDDMVNQPLPLPVSAVSTKYCHRHECTPLQILQ
ncbi:hypothetical protein HDU76_000122 [Blyttiomyces sp. JEL0837]|nr:hypothetical protein HDU76_000122 [Blyttiomyces sp. JEL0837]